VENSRSHVHRLVEVYEEYKDLRKANDSKVERKNSDGVTETYDFSNVMSDDMVINAGGRRGLSPKTIPSGLAAIRPWPCNAQFMGPTLRKQA